MSLDNLSDDDLIAISQKNYDALSDDGLLALASVKTKRKTTLGEDFQIGLGNAASTLTKGVGLLAGGAAGALGATDISDKIFSETDRIAKETQDYWTPQDAEQTFGGKLASMVTTLPAQMLAMPFSPADTGMSMVNNGETLDKAITGTLLDTVGNTAGLAINPAGGLGKRVLQGAALNAGQDFITRKAIADLADTEATKQQFNPTLETTALAGVMGAGFGVLPSGNNTKVTVGDKTPYTKPTTQEPKLDLKLSKDVENAIAVREASIKAIDDQLARQKDPQSDYSIRLLEDRMTKVNELSKLYASLGQDTPVRNTSRTDVDGSRIDDQLVAEYNAKEVELSALESEYKKLSKRGAALTTEQRIRLQEVEARYNETADWLEANLAKVHGDEIIRPTEIVKSWDTLEKGGTTTLYRGESLENDANGQWWTTDRKLAERYGTVSEVTLPDELIGKYAAKGHHGSSEFVFPNKKPHDLINTKQEFEPLPTRDAVQDSILNKDYSDYSIPILQNMLANKTRKLSEFSADSDMLNRLNAERSHIEAALTKKLTQQSKSDFSFHSAAEEKLAWVLREPMLEALRRGGIREGLALLADPKNHADLNNYGRALGKLAKALLDNPLVGAGKYVEDPNFQHAGGFDNISGYVHMKGDTSSSPTVFLHEVVHSAVNRALSLFSRGQLTDPQQVRGARAITELYNSIKNSKEKMATLARFMDKESLAIVFENSREFVAYGISDHRFMLALDHIKMGPTKVFSSLSNAIKNILGLKGEERTALDDVLRYGELLIQTSEGLPPGFDPNKPHGLYSFNKMTKAQDAVAAIKSGSQKIFAHTFTQNLPQLMRHDPHFPIMEKKIMQAERAKENLVRDINHGFDALPDWKNKGKYFYPISGSDKATALVPSMRPLKGERIHSVYSKLVDGYRNGVDAADTIKANEAQWSPEEKIFAEAINKATTKLWEASVKMLANKGLDYTKLKQRIGYMLTSRVGDHTMQARINGVLVKQQHFLTKKEADHWIKQVKAQNPDADVTYAHTKDIKEGNATQSLKDFLNTLSGLHGKDLEDFIKRTDEAMNEQNSNIGVHTMQSNIVGGFIGDQFGMTPRQMGEQLRTAIPRMVENYAQNIMSRSVQKDYIDFQIDYGHKIDPTTNELLNYYIQTQIGVPYKDGSWSAAAHDLSVKTREFFSERVDSVFGYKNRDMHAIDRFMGLFNNAFYISNILMKPAIWVAQPLQALNSLRSAFKEGETPRQVLTAFGETLMQLSIGKATGKLDPQLEKDIHFVATHYNTFHPQMTNDYNDIRIGTDPNSALNKAVDTISGKKISAWGDQGSRYASFLFFYNLHKRSGLTGTELRDKAARDATDNMVAYGSKKVPAIYREMGIVGEQGATLATFAHAQLGNMLVDINEFVKQPSARTSAPLIMTSAVMMALGGAVSLPILAEYELLRQAGVRLGWWGNEWPNVSELIMDYAPRWVSMGMLSDATGIDMDASMRYTSLFNKLIDIEKEGILAFAPHLAWGSDVVANVIPAISHNSTVPERDQALKKVLPKGWVSGIVDQARNNWDLVTNEGPAFTRMGKQGQGGVVRDTKAKIAPFIGSSTTEQAMDNRKLLAGRERDKRVDSLVEKAVQYYVYGDEERGNKTLDKLLVEAKGYSKANIDQKIENQIAKMNSPGLFNRYWNPKTGEVSPDQQDKIIRDNLGAYLQRRVGK